MKIDELIARLEEEAQWQAEPESNLLLKAAATIRLLWEIAQDSSNSKYKRQIDEWSGNNDKTNAD